MSRIARCLLLTVGGAWLVACGPRPDLAADRAAILAGLEDGRAAHFERDARKFLARYADTYTVALNGDVHARTKAEMLPGLEQYLSSMEFDALDELTPTQLHISDDGTTAWLIGNVRVRGRQRQDDGGMTPIAFRSAWIDLYRKIDGRWVVVARANTQGDEPGAVAPR